MMANSKKMRSVVLEITTGLMENTTQGTGSKIKCMGMEFLNGLTVAPMRATFNKIKEMERVR